MNVNKEIVDYYNLGEEAERLKKGWFILEGVRTKEIISRYIEKKPSKILDVGGATGFYSNWLSEEGHEVHLVDPSPVNIMEAKKVSEKSKKPVKTISIGEAQNLNFEDEYFDIVLMMGPLYHLTLRNDRLTALSEAMRVLSEGGILICAVISRFASLLDGFFNGLVNDPHYTEIMKSDLIDGQHRNETGKPKYFTTAFFHHPDELRDELKQAGFRHETLIAVESFGWLIPDFEEKWKDEESRNLLLEQIRKVESEPAITGMTSHILGIGKK